MDTFEKKDRQDLTTVLKEYAVNGYYSTKGNWNIFRLHGSEEFMLTYSNRAGGARMQFVSKDNQLLAISFSGVSQRFLNQVTSAIDRTYADLNVAPVIESLRNMSEETREMLFSY